MAITTNLEHVNPALRAVARTRNLVGPPHGCFQDANYSAYLEAAGYNAVADAAGTLAPELRTDFEMLAAALALYAIGTDATNVQKVIEDLGLKTDGAAEAASYQSHAKSLREMVAQRRKDRTDALAKAEADVEKAAALQLRTGRSIGTRRIDGYSACRGSEHAARRPWRGCR